MIKFVQLHGHVPSHMDGHQVSLGQPPHRESTDKALVCIGFAFIQPLQHVHVIPFIAPLFAAIAKESDVRWVRMPLDSGIPNTSSQRLTPASAHPTATPTTSAPTHQGVQPLVAGAGSPTIPPRVSITWVEAERMRFYEEVCRNARTAAPIFIQHGLRFADEFVGYVCSAAFIMVGGVSGLRGRVSCTRMLSLQRMDACSRHDGYYGGVEGTECISTWLGVLIVHHALSQAWPHGPRCHHRACQGPDFSCSRLCLAQGPSE